jgi:hypothetical protein
LALALVLGGMSLGGCESVREDIGDTFDSFVDWID